MGDFVFNKSFVAKSSLESFLDDLAMEIQDADIGLDEYCNQGGGLDEVEVRNLQLTGTRQGGIVEGSFDVAFTEVYHNGCRDIEWTDHYSGTMNFDFNLETQEFKITHEEIQRVLSPAEQADLDEREKYDEEMPNVTNLEIVDEKKQFTK
jgi:hypothetical protein